MTEVGVPRSAPDVVYMPGPVAQTGPHSLGAPLKINLPLLCQHSGLVQSILREKYTFDSVSVGCVPDAEMQQWSRQTGWSERESD